MLRKTWTACKVLLMAIGVAYLVATITPLDTWWANKLSSRWDDPKGDILIVLGSETLADGMIGQSSYWRSVYAARIWRQAAFREVIFAGARVGEAMRQFVVCQGIPASATAVEDQSRSTRDNALFMRRMLDGQPGPKILLTSDFHMFRAWRAFRKAGLDVAPSPIPDALKQASNWQNRWTVFVTLSIESAKIGYYWARGWI